MIRALLIQNRAGKTRLAKYYAPFTDAEKERFQAEVYRLVSQRDPKLPNFLEARARPPPAARRLPPRRSLSSLALEPPPPLRPSLRPHSSPSPPPSPTPSSRPQHQAHKLVYRRYAGLFFALAVDPGDSELLALEAVHLLVEILDHYFGSVCELDLVFGFHKAYCVLDEFIVGGEVAETSKKVVLDRLRELAALEV
jgi:AP-2 complex subunit sigma-1